ncbi:hypothetical protein BDN70DRAFT_939410 [Pholiota conissans]|uniref:Uncharacterized protein n=1 Tax=Pholiota conissans TaxID=109636 RepID=A0A9P6CS89_9AGAR|nr:hypothetical protein BDN70DRAFT_939410 [Pholiota conissans]
MALSIKPHPPLISTRIEFGWAALPPPPEITVCHDFSSRIRRYGRHYLTPYSRPKTREGTPFRHVREGTPWVGDMEDTPSRRPRERSRSPTMPHRQKTPATMHTFGRALEPEDKDRPNLRDSSPLMDMPSDPSDNEGGEVSTLNMIPKPSGEAGRRNSGGYNLQKALHWGERYINEQVSKKLNPTMCYSKQDKDKLDEVVEAAARKLDIHRLYAKDWPIRDALKLQLKYTSDNEKKRALKKANNTLKRVILDTSTSKRGGSD